MTNKSPAILLEQIKPAFASRDRFAINAIIGELLAQDASIGDHWLSFADVLIHNGEFDLARRAIEKFARHQHNAPLARFYQASVLSRAGDVARARDILASLPENVPDPVGNAYTQGTVELNLGNIDAARAHLRKAVVANPRSGQSLLALAMTGRLGGDAETADSLLAAAAGMEAAPVLERAQYAYAQGKVFDELGEHRLAFEAWTEGGALLQTQRPYQVEADARSAAVSVERWDRDRIGEIGAKVECATDRPILVTGSPRSGTTLVEQILVSHSAVCGGTELGKFNLLLQRFGGLGLDRFEGWLSKGGTENEAAADYVHLFEQQFGPQGRAVDKTPDASRYLGLAAALLPETPIVWLRRDRLDGALSCFRTYFFKGVAWSHVQKNLAHHFRLEDDLLKRWQDLLGDRLLIVDYESLVDDPVSQIDHLLAHCSLAPEPAVYEPHKTQRVVTTASVTQVREPINRRSIGAAQNYREQLEPFVTAYRALGGTIA